MKTSILLYQEMASSVLNEDIMVQKGCFELSGNTHILPYYPIVSSQNIDV